MKLLLLLLLLLYILYLSNAAAAKNQKRGRTTNLKSKAKAKAKPVARSKNRFCIPIADVSKCIVRNITYEDDEDNKLTPMTQHPKLVKTFEATDSEINILPRGVCDSFPNLENITLVTIQLGLIQPDALENCRKLRWVKIENNTFPGVADVVFKNNHLIEYLSLNANALVTSDMTALNPLVNLKYLSLYDNLVDEFPWPGIRVFPKLEVLNMGDNEYKVINAKKVLQYFPKLKKLHIGGDEFACEQEKEFRDEIKELRKGREITITADECTAKALQLE